MESFSSFSTRKMKRGLTRVTPVVNSNTRWSGHRCNPPINDEDVIWVGYIKKQSSTHRQWQRRWFVLTTKELVYFQNKEERNVSGRFPIRSMKVYLSTDENYEFNTPTQKLEEGAKSIFRLVVTGQKETWLDCNCDETGGSMQDPDPPESEDTRPVALRKCEKLLQHIIRGRQEILKKEREEREKAERGDDMNALEQSFESFDVKTRPRAGSKEKKEKKKKGSRLRKNSFSSGSSGRSRTSSASDQPPVFLLPKSPSGSNEANDEDSDEEEATPEKVMEEFCIRCDQAQRGLEIVGKAENDRSESESGYYNELHKIAQSFLAVTPRKPVVFTIETLPLLAMIQSLSKTTKADAEPSGHPSLEQVAKGIGQALSPTAAATDKNPLYANVVEALSSLIHAVESIGAHPGFHASVLQELSNRR